MNPLGIIATAASLTLSIGLMATSDPEVDTWGLVPGSTAYSPVEPGALPDASGSDYSAVNTQVHRGFVQPERILLLAFIS